MKTPAITRRAAVIAGVAASPLANAQWFNKALGAQAEFFNAQYYANMNSDLIAAGIVTYTQLRQHWLGWGINEGRSAHPHLDPRAYLARYADLRAAFGASNWRAAYNHYVSNGQYEGRNGRSASLLSARLGDVSIAASGRCTGAIDSLWFHGRETVNSYDHGRQLQTALYDKYYDACFNPTQAGRRADSKGYASSSRLLSAQALGTTGFRTKTQCAYWVGPNETITDAGVVSCHAGNLNSVLSGFTADTTYTLSQSGNTTIISARTEWVGDTDLPPGRAQVVPVTGYHIRDFSWGIEVVRANGYAARARQVGTLADQGREQPHPVIFSTPDGVSAIGVVNIPVPGAATTYALYRWLYGQNHETNDSSSWAVVNRYPDLVPAGTPMVSHNVIVLGQVTDVHLKIRDTMIATGA